MEKRQTRRGRYTPADFYEHGKNRLTYAQLAEHYEVSQSAIGAQLAKPELKAAFRAGKNGEPFLSSDAPTQTPGADTKPEELQYAEIERRVLAAIDDHFCSEAGIKNHAGFPRSFDISEILKGMIVDRKIRRESAGDVATAYFRFNWKVKRFWRDGTAIGKFGIEFEQGDGVRFDRKSIGTVRAEIYQKLREISELVKSL
jgi:hypothetical protein